MNRRKSCVYVHTFLVHFSTVPIFLASPLIQDLLRDAVSLPTNYGRYPIFLVIVLVVSILHGHACNHRILQIFRKTCRIYLFVGTIDTTLKRIILWYTHLGWRTSTFIFCFGVLSPCLMTATTQRNSILKKRKKLNIYYTSVY